MMKYLLVAALATSLLIAGCAQEATDTPKDNPTTTQQSSGSFDGKALFQANCAACHNPLKDATGPALHGALQRWGGDSVQLRAFVHNPSSFATKNTYAKALFEKYKPVVMTPFPNLTEAEIDAIMNYCDQQQPSIQSGTPVAGH